MSLTNELAQLFARDLTRVAQQIAAFPDSETLWAVVPGISNSAGNLVLHLEGNLREYIGRQLGGVAYQRQRPLEFSASGLPASDLTSRIEAVRDLVTNTIGGLSEGDIGSHFPEHVFGKPMSTGQFLVHLHGHLNYHLGQIDYLRRLLTGNGAIELAGL